MGCPPENAAGIAEWTSCAQRDSSQARERVRLAATMLLTAAQSIEPNLRLAHALDWALHKRWIGLDDTGRAMIAACSVGNSGNAGWPEDLDRLASQEDLHAAHTWGLAIRLCRRFSGLSRKALELSKLAVTDGKLSLTVDGSLASLRSEGTTKDLRNLAESLGLEPSLQVS
jgi:exopolyphosphatase/guanosine-5'-triphosphate,3'-diphosphate pyrophosphatase